jgi:hypothetical protein
VTTLLAEVRTDLFDALAALGMAQTYRRRTPNYEYPAYIVGWPQSMNVRPAMGDPRDFVIDVYVGVEVTDDESCDDLLSELLEAAVTALQATAHWDVQPATDFGEGVTADGRAIIGCRLPVAVWS